MPSSLAELQTVAVVLWMGVGFTHRPGRWFRWKLFANATFSIVTLTGTKNGRTEPVNPYTELSPGSLLLPPPYSRQSSATTYTPAATTGSTATDASSPPEASSGSRCATAVWLFDAVTSGFQYPTDPSRLQMFRIAFGAVLTFRFAAAFTSGGWNRFAPDQVQAAFARRRHGDTRARVLFAVYRPMLVLRALAAPALALGLAPRLTLPIVLAGATTEFAYLRSPSAVRYIILTGTCLLLAGDLGHGLTLTHAPSHANTWAQFLLVLVTTDIYLNSAWHKIRSSQFRSGLYLAQFIHTYAQVKNDLRHRRQFAIPRLVQKHLGNLTSRDIRAWRALSVTVIAVELALPIGLLLAQTRPYAEAAGIAMHAAFSCLKPIQLVTFSGLVTASYLAFAP
ncbi:hypothetical protein ACFU7Y_20255 [Kitasatospora sp. NPDC057542]|uniref:hypothetical protein n=1 Tax=Kitasatospora sp. NPDC057542 TaxID=3346162 RepID=UPI0036C3915C